MQRFLRPGGPTFGFGHRTRGYVEVSLLDSPPRPGSVYSIEEIYARLNAHARRKGPGNATFRFALYPFLPEMVLYGNTGS
jgi:hypothetical protein